MTDLVKTYKPSAAKAVVSKRGEGTVVIKGDRAAIIDKPKFRAAPIRMPVMPETRKEFIFAMCDHLNAQGMPYKELRRKVQDEAFVRGWKYVSAEISRWRHRFN